MKRFDCCKYPNNKYIFQAFVCSNTYSVAHVSGWWSVHEAEPRSSDTHAVYGLKLMGNPYKVGGQIAYQKDASFILLSAAKVRVLSWYVWLIWVDNAKVFIYSPMDPSS